MREKLYIRSPLTKDNCMLKRNTINATIRIESKKKRGNNTNCGIMKHPKWHKLFILLDCSIVFRCSFFPFFSSELDQQNHCFQPKLSPFHTKKSFRIETAHRQTEERNNEYP